MKTKSRRPDGVAVPTVDVLKAERKIEGNLVAMRHAFERVVTRPDGSSSGVIRRDVVVKAQNELLDRQDETLRQLGATPLARSGLLRLADSASPVPMGRSRTVEQLVDGFRKLCRGLAVADDEQTASG